MKVSASSATKASKTELHGGKAEPRKTKATVKKLKVSDQLMKVSASSSTKAFKTELH